MIADNEKHWLQQQVEDNLIQLITIIVSVAVAIAVTKVKYDNLILRVQAIEQKQAEYPSQDWFQLKFKILEDKINELAERTYESNYPGRP